MFHMDKKISGDFPDLRYFSLQTYGQSGMTLDTKFDFELKTDDIKNSINPFANRMEYRTFKQKVLPKGSWTIYMTGTGDEGFNNELLGWDSTMMNGTNINNDSENQTKIEEIEEQNKEDSNFDNDIESENIESQKSSTGFGNDGNYGLRNRYNRNRQGRSLLNQVDNHTEKFIGRLMRKLQETEANTLNERYYGSRGDSNSDTTTTTTTTTDGDDNDNGFRFRGKDEENETIGQPIILVQRFYGKDPTIIGKKDAWGNVPKPIIEHKRKGETEWSKLETCQEGVRGNMLRMVQELEQVSDDTDRGKNHPGHCPLSLDNWEGLAPTDFYLFGGGWEKDYPGFDEDAVFKNGDSSYLYWCESTKRMGEDYIIRIKGKLPRTPVGLYTESGKPKIHQRNKYDARYISISAVDLSLPGNTYQSYSDTDMKSFYESKNGIEWDRNYDIIASENIELAKACNMIDEEKQMFLPFDRAGINKPEVPSIFYRELIATSTLTGVPAHSVADVKRACANNELCRDPNYLKDLMGQYYPEIEIYKCDTRTGFASKIIKN